MACPLINNSGAATFGTHVSLPAWVECSKCMHIAQESNRKKYAHLFIDHISRDVVTYAHG